MKYYRSFDEFAREELRPLTRVGFSLDEFDIDTPFDDLVFDEDEFEDDED